VLQQKKLCEHDKIWFHQELSVKTFKGKYHSKNVNSLIFDVNIVATASDDKKLNFGAFPK